MEFKEIIENFKTNRKAQIVTIVVLLVLVAAAIAGIFFFNTNSSINNNVNVNLTSVKNTNLFPIAVMIENYKDVRPQFGLSKASIIYEALAEGGITRFLAIYTTNEKIETIGPVRSARHYYVDWAEEYHGLFAHIGGSPEALGILSVQDYLTDLNQFGYSQYYWRDEEKAAPHNLFTSSELLAYAIRDLNINTTPTYQNWITKEEANKNNRPTEEKLIKIDFSTDDYSVEWKYNKENNSYLRFNGGVEHKDALNDEQIEAKNVIVQYAETSLMDQTTGRLDIITQGEGKIVIFMDGEYIEGTWKKLNRGERTKFYNNNGEEISINNGLTWIEVVQIDTNIEWTK